MKTERSTKANISFAALIVMLMMGSVLLMTACQAKVTPSSPGVATVTSTPSATPIVNVTPTTLGPGDVAFLGMDTNVDPGGNDSWAFAVLKATNAGTTVFFTDEGWDLSTSASSPATFTQISNDHIVGWVAPSGGVTAGTVVVLNPTGGTSFNVGNFIDAYNFGGGGSAAALAFASSADSLIAFQATSVDSTSGAVTSPVFLGGFNFVPWLTSGAVVTGTSYIPGTLTDGSTAGHYASSPPKNFWYSGTLALNDTEANLLAVFYNSANWTSSSSGSIFGGTYPSTSFPSITVQ